MEMKKNKFWLTALLIIQVIAVIILYTSSQREASFNVEATVIDSDVNSATMLVIEGDNKNVSLINTSDGWVLKDTRLPVNKALIDNLIMELNDLKMGWPIAETTSSHSRFEVLDNDFKRHIQIYNNDDLLSDLYLGSSPGFKKTHLRKAGEKEVYTVALNSVELPVSVNEWMDKSLLSVKEPSKITGLDYVLTKSTDGWSFTGLSDALKTTSKKVNFDEFVTVFDNLEVLNVIENPTNALDSPERVIEVTNDENTWTYKVAFSGDDLYLQRNDYDLIFNIRKEDYDLLSSVNLAILDIRREKSAHELEESISIDDDVPLSVEPEPLLSQ